MAWRRPTRRQFLGAALGGAVLGVSSAPLVAAPAQAPPVGAGIVPLNDDLFVVSIPGEANVVVHLDAEGVVLVDGASKAGADALAAAVGKVAGNRPVHTLFNTHWHPEQTGSNERLGTA